MNSGRDRAVPGLLAAGSKGILLDACELTVIPRGVPAPYRADRRPASVETRGQGPRGPGRRPRTVLSAEAEPRPLLAPAPEARPARRARSPSRDERPGDTVRTSAGSPPAPALRYFGCPDPPRNR